MADVVREIHIDAAPDVVREHLTDPKRRSGWLDEGHIEVAPTRTGVTYTRSEDADSARVDIDVLPEGDGSRVRVTEQVQERQAPVEPPASDTQALWAVSPERGKPDEPAAPDAIRWDHVTDGTHGVEQAPTLAQAA